MSLPTAQKSNRIASESEGLLIAHVEDKATADPIPSRKAPVLLDIADITEPMNLFFFFLFLFIECIIPPFFILAFPSLLATHEANSLGTTSNITISLKNSSLFFYLVQKAFYFSPSRLMKSAMIILMPRESLNPRSLKYRP